MNKSHTLSAIFLVLGIFGLALGSLIAIKEEASFGRTMMLAAAIIIAGALIRSAILEKTNQ